jgi:hypothetical protein
MASAFCCMMYLRAYCGSSCSNASLRPNRLIFRRKRSFHHHPIRQGKRPPCRYRNRLPSASLTPPLTSSLLLRLSTSRQQRLNQELRRIRRGRPRRKSLDHRAPLSVSLFDFANGTAKSRGDSKTDGRVAKYHRRRELPAYSWPRSSQGSTLHNHLIDHPMGPWTNLGLRRVRQSQR